MKQARGAVKDVYGERARAALARGDLDGAVSAYREAIRRGSKSFDVYNNLAVIFGRRGDLAQAVPLFETALQLRGAPPETKINLARMRAARGLARLNGGDLEGAVEDFERALALDPTLAKSRSNLGLALAGLGRLAEAVVSYEKALALVPDDALTHNNLGVALTTLGRHEAAAAALGRARTLDASDARVPANLAVLEQRRGEMERAAAFAREALAMDPQSVEAHNCLGAVQLQQGRIDESLVHLRLAVSLAPKRIDVFSGYVQALNYDPTATPDFVAAEHRRIEDACRGELPEQRDFGPRREGRLRVGYVSPDFRGHSVASFFEPLLATHDRQRVEVTCYSDVANPDAVTARLRANAEHWCDIAGQPDSAVARRIRDDGIDLLVDLAGHTDGNRMALFARRAAPVQVTYLGYPNTTGLATMDYRITDAVADPEGAADARHSERLLRIDGGFLCYAPPTLDVPVAPCPFLVDGHLTFGSFNNLAKLNATVIAAWSRLLHAVPDARLLVKAGGLRSSEARERLWSVFGGHGISRERVELVAPLAAAEHLAAYARIDVALDPFPYNGTTTTCEALWMGVPVATFAGDVHAARVGATLLERIGLQAPPAATSDPAVESALMLARDRDRLVALRGSLRDRLRASALMDATRLARALESAFARMVDGSR